MLDAIKNFAKRLRKKVLIVEGQDLYNQLVKEVISDCKNIKSDVQVFKYVEGLPMLTGFGADMIDSFISGTCRNAKAHYPPGYAGQFMPRAIFNDYKEFWKDTLLHCFETRLSEYNLTDYKFGELRTERLIGCLDAMRKLTIWYPMTLYKTDDIRVIYTDVLKALCNLISAILKDVPESEYRELAQAYYERTTELYWPLSVSGYKYLYEEVSFPHERVRMIPVRRRLEHANAQKFTSPLMVRDALAAAKAAGGGKRGH